MDGVALDRMTRPVAVHSRPDPTTARGPKRLTRRLERGAPIIIITPIGNCEYAALNGAKPLDSWRYCEKMKKSPNRAKYCSVMVPDPTAKLRFRNNRMSSIGSGLRSSHQQKAPSEPTPAAIDMMIGGVSHPRSGPSMIP